MKQIVFIAIAAIAFATATQAQDSAMSREQKKEHGMMKARRSDAMSELNLTPDQQTKMKKLREDNRTKMEAIQHNASLSDEQKQEQLKSLHTEQRKNMEDILTDEQKTKWKEARKQQMMQRREMKSDSDSIMHR